MSDVVFPASWNIA